MRRVAPRHFLAGLCITALSAISATAGALEHDSRPRPKAVAEHADDASSTRALDASLNSPDLRIRVLAGRSFDPRDETWTRTFIPVDTLARLARDSTDPMVLAMMIAPCDNDRLVPRPTCDPVDMATRWTTLDPDNQVAWLTLSSTLRSHGDRVGATKAFHRAAAATRWHEYSDDGARVVLRALPPAPGASGQMTALRTALASSVADLRPDAALDALAFQCAGGTADADCRRVVYTIDRGAGSLSSARTALAIGRTIGIDPAHLAARTQKLDTLEMQSSIPSWKRPDDLADATARATEASALQRGGLTGELPWMPEQFAGGRFTSAAAARRDVERVEALQYFRIVAPTAYAY